MSEAHPSGLPCYRVLSAGDTALTIELGEGIDRRISALVLALTRRLNERLLRGVVETLPTLRSLTVYYDPLVLPAKSLLAHIEEPDVRAENGRADRTFMGPAGLL